MTNFKKQLFLKIGIGLLGVIVFAVLMFLLNSDINKRIAQIQKYKQEFTSQRQAIDTLTSLKIDFEKAEPYIDDLENFLPTKDNLLLFPKDIDIIAKKNNIDFGFVFGAETQSTEQELGYFNFSSTAAGGFNNLTQFLSDIYKSKYFVSFASIDLNKKGDLYNSNLTGRIFSR